MPVTTWQPTDRQADFFRIPDEVFEGLFGGAAGGGKTDALAAIPFAKKDRNNKPLYTNPRFKMLFLRRTYTELEKEVIARTKGSGHIPPYEAFDFLPYQEQKRRWTNKSGAVIQFGHCEHEDDVRRYDTDEYNIIAFDEVTSFTPFQYEYLSFSRCRTSSLDLPAFVRAGTNPGNISHGYFRSRFVEPCRTGNTILRETRKGKIFLRIFIPSKVTDNPYLMLADPDYINRMEMLPDAERAAKKEGDWWTFSGQVFDDFRTNPFPDEPYNAKHICEPFQVPDYWPSIISIDWGYSAMTIAGRYRINPLPNDKYPAKIYKTNEYTCKKTKISTWASDLQRIWGDPTQHTDIVLDPSAWQDRGDPTNIAEQFALHYGRQPRRAYNNRVGGKLLLQELLRWRNRPPRYVPQTGFDPDLANQIRRQNGPKAYNEYVSLFRSDAAASEELVPQLQIFPECVETIKTIPLCVYDKDHPEDVAEFDGDDPYDETRYGVSACQNYMDGGLLAAENNAKRASICSTSEQGLISPTAFYMQMDNLEARERRSFAGVKKFHGSRRVYRNY